MFKVAIKQIYSITFQVTKTIFYNLLFRYMFQVAIKQFFIPLYDLSNLDSIHYVGKPPQ